jgi:hypothetical protein
VAEGMFDPAFAGRQVRLWVQKTPSEAILKGFLYFLANES